MLRELTRRRGTQPLHCHGFQSSLGRKEGAAALYPFKGWEVGGADPEPRGADAREAHD